MRNFRDPYLTKEGKERTLENRSKRRAVNPFYIVLRCSLVHGEFEHSDIAEYFGERLSGVVITQNGWVQSHSLRCVWPPVIYDDVSCLQAMTVNWSRFAQSLTSRVVKGMLMGLVTHLQWSFVRDDRLRSATCQLK